ncbi:helix-turn-helix domain-containing protein [Ralstonia pseudosolanacearum]|uniref:helix-turn-helix domain-containing protein n=1 Tax=Ralstonia pseudosolanacearum TaxID=1310165 RepID=UPI003CF39E00
MKCIVELSEAEKRTLPQLALMHRHQDFRLPGQGLLLLGAGQRVRDIAAQLDVSKNTIYNLAHWCPEKGLSGLLVGHQGGRPGLLSEEMIAAAVQAACAKSRFLN